MFHIINGDITSHRHTTTTNVNKKVSDQVKKFIGTTYKKSDIYKVIHLVDTDGAYVDQTYIRQGDVDSFIYSSEYIEAKNIDQVISRNEKKSKILNKLSNYSTIYGVKYSMYYFSRNLEHVLHGQSNVEDALKSELAEKFSETYFKKEQEFVKYISNGEIAVTGEYSDTWKFIKEQNNSLKRFTNFHLFFKELLKT